MLPFPLVASRRLGDRRLGDRRSAQHRPRDIGPQVFAPNGIADGVRLALDVRASLGGHGADALAPLVDGGGRDAQSASQFGLTAYRITRPLDGGSGFAHVGTVALLTPRRKAMLSRAVDSIAYMDEWTPDEEARRLRDRFEMLKHEKGISKAEFARAHDVPGGPSMVSQHTGGHRPINLDAATAYARGFGVTIEEISPRLARQVATAAATSGGSMVEEDHQQHGEDVVPASEEEHRLFRAFRLLTEDEQRAALRQVEEYAAGAIGKRYLEGKLGAKGYADDHKVARALGTPANPPRKRPTK